MIDKEIYPWITAQWQALQREQAAGKLPHAVLLEGLPGTGRNALAERLAALALCSGDGDEPCGSCSNCKMLAGGQHPDLARVGIEEGKTRISIEHIRKLIHDLQLRSHAGGIKAGIVTPADLLSIGGANAMLKTLEEPPGPTLLILVCKRAASLPATIRSRCRRIHLSVPPQEQALQWLDAQQPEVDWTAVLPVAGGAPLRALALNEQGFASLAETLSADLRGIITRKEEPLAAAGRWAGHDPSACLAWLRLAVINIIRQRMLGPNPGPGHSNSPESLQKCISGLTLRSLFEYFDQVESAPRLLEGQANPTLVFESLLVPWSQGLRTDSSR